MCRFCNPLPPAPLPLPPLPPRGDLLPLTAEQLSLPYAGYDNPGYALPEIEKRDGAVIPPVLIACSECGEEHEQGSDELREHSQNAGEYLCDECSCSCEYCGGTYAQSDNSGIRMAHRHNQSGESYRCDNCSWRCADCREHFYGDGSPNSSGETICQSCSEQYTCCEDCNDTIHVDNSHYDENFAEGSFCESCYDEREREYRAENGDEEQEREDAPAPAPSRESTSLIKPYSYKPSPKFAYAEGEASHAPAVFYGLELETENSGHDHASAIRSSGLADDGQFYCKKDGSLTDGFEIVSHPGTLKFWRKHSFAFCEKLANEGYQSLVSSCGLHIHVSRSALTTPQIAKLLLFSKANAEFMKYVSGRISMRQMDTYAPVENLSTRLLVRKAEQGNSHDNRYAAINLENDATIEFRLFQGTLNASHIKRTLAFVACLIEFIRQAPLTRLHEGDFRSFLALRARSIVGRGLASALITWLSGTLADAA